LNALRELLVLGVGVMIAGGVGLALALRRQALRWTWALLGLLVSFVPWQIEGLLGVVAFMIAGLASLLGMGWHHSDIAYGADHAEAANARLGDLSRVAVRQRGAPRAADRPVGQRRVAATRARSEGDARLDPRRV
jgi:hypothetical protein